MITASYIATLIGDADPMVDEIINTLIKPLFLESRETTVTLEAQKLDRNNFIISSEVFIIEMEKRGFSVDLVIPEGTDPIGRNLLPYYSISIPPQEE